jgi:prepilin-type N-terminal cleavage/methylation domain-containing protein
MRRVSAFSLIEILAVIAIIAILSAIIFPVYARAKDSAFRSGDMASMNQLRTALGLYYNDQGAYPPQLLGYVTLYQSGPNAGQVIPAGQLESYLYKRRVRSIETFKPAYNRSQYNVTTTAVYPNHDIAERPIGTNPLMDLDGDGDVDSADDIAEARQAYEPADGDVCMGGGTITNACPSNLVAQFYKMSGYDVAEVTDPATGGLRTELRYTLFWTEFALNQNGSASDDPRQLGYAFPPEDTIVTWNSYFRELDSQRRPKPINRDIVLFLGGSARPADSDGLFNKSWRYPVNP